MQTRNSFLELKIRTLSVGKMLAVALTNLRTPFLFKYLHFLVLFYITDTSSENHLEEAGKDFIVIFYLPYADCTADVMYRRKGLKLNYLYHKCTSGHLSGTNVISMCSFSVLSLI